MEEIEIDLRALQLLEKITESRLKLESFSDDVERMKDKVLSIFPTDINARNKFLLDDKLKISSNFFSTLLSYRQEINKTLKTEFELITKFKPKNTNSEGSFDVRQAADEVEQVLKKNSTKKLELDDGYIESSDGSQHQSIDDKTISTESELEVEKILENDLDFD